MGGGTQARVLAIMGSGETSPTMVTIHKALARRLGPGRHRAVLLDTPYAFQENAADISARSQAYFARSVGLTVEVISEAARAGGAVDGDVAAVRGCDWVFAGPGSPSYALARWRGGGIAGALRDRIAAGTGITIIASAAAAAMGLRAVPVYEIYKAGADPSWLEGLDLLSVLGLKVAVIPHYDNAEGGTHDTRFCYLGERRLSALERELPAGCAVLGVDEHTALVLDLAAQHVKVLGRGGATVRRAGTSTVLHAGSAMTLPGLRDLVAHGQAHRGTAGAPAVAAGHAGPAGRVPGGELPELTALARHRFDAATRTRNVTEMVAAILDLETAIDAWSSDTDENDNADRARAILRGLVVRLGKDAECLAAPADRLRPAVEPLIALRASLRAEGAFAAADQIRTALAAAGIELRDSRDGTRWVLSDGNSRAGC